MCYINLLNYGLDEFLPCFPLLKSREKLLQQDRIWKQICQELKWNLLNQFNFFLINYYIQIMPEENDNFKNILLTIFFST